MYDSKLCLPTIYAIWVVVSYVLSFNILKMFVTDIRKEFYEVVANQVSMSSLRLQFVFNKFVGAFGQRTFELRVNNLYSSCLETISMLLLLFYFQRVVLLVAPDVDALCACKILQVRSIHSTRSLSVNIFNFKLYGFA